MIFEERFIEVDAIIVDETEAETEPETSIKVCINKAHIISIDDQGKAGCEIYIFHASAHSGDIITREAYSNILHRLKHNIFSNNI